MVDDDSSGGRRSGGLVVVVQWHGVRGFVTNYFVDYNQ